MRGHTGLPSFSSEELSHNPVRKLPILAIAYIAFLASSRMQRSALPEETG